MSDLWSQHAALLAEIEDVFERIAARHRARIECRAGCSDCCRCRLSVAHVEAEYFAKGLAALPPSLRERLRRQARDPDREMCPALGDDGNCQVYAWRPVICRSHGIPLRYPARVPLAEKKVIDVCDKNFVGVALHTLPEHDSLDQVALMARLAKLNDAHCAEHNLDPEERVPLAHILSTQDA